MKENDVRVDYEPHQLLLYAEKEDGTYGPVQTGAFATKNYLDILLDNRARIVREGIEKLRAGTISPVAYYCELSGMTVADLAVRAALPVSKVKKHFTPGGFSSMSVAVLQRYAEVFDIPPANLFHVVVPKREGIGISSKKTANPLFTITEIN